MSALIFVALAVGWAAYLIPQLLKRGDDDGSVLVEPVVPRAETGAARVLPRTSALTREALAKRAAASAPAPSQPSEPAVPAVPPVVRRRMIRAARRSARRRSVVLVMLLLATVAVGVLAFLGQVASMWVWVPGFLVACWLIVCRTAGRAAAARIPAAAVTTRASLAVEDVVAPPLAQAAVAPAPTVPEASVVAEVADDREDTAEIVLAPALWDPVPITLPTYVGKPAARRTVRTIELRGDGVTSSGHDAADSELARKAAAERKLAEADAEAVRRRAAG